MSGSSRFALGYIRLNAIAEVTAGVSVELHSFPDTFHGSALVPTAEVAQRGSGEVMNVLRRRPGAR